VSQEVAAVIPTFRPDPGSLLSLVRDLRALNVPVLVADDASPCTVDPILRDASEEGACVVRHRRNAGIARSLNDGLRFAAAQGALWLLTVDQDSTLPPDYLPRLLAAAADAENALGPDAVGAVAAGGIADASGDLGYPLIASEPVATTHEVIQTGTLWAVDPLIALGGFDERLGIDGVDAAACLALRSAGLQIVVASGVEIVHRIGEGRQVRVLGRDVLASGHGPERRTTIVHNRLRLFPAEFAQSPTHALRTMRRVAMNTALAVTVEDDRWAKAKASARGLLPRRNG
jgi:rhamnosyltransferase